MDDSGATFEMERINTLHGPEWHRADGLEPSTVHNLVRTSDPRWLLIDEGFTLAREREVESLFAIGNGYVGNRASLAEASALSVPGTFVAGIFTHPTGPGAVPQLMVLPDWAAVRIWIEGRPLDMGEGQVLEHRRILDMSQAVLWREWRHRDPNGRVTHIMSARLASLADRHLLFKSLALRAENYSGIVQFESALELAPQLEPFLPEDWKTRRSSERPNVLPLALRTPGREHTAIAFGVASQLLSSTVEKGNREVSIEERRIVERFQARLEARAECQLHRVVSIFTSRDVAKPLDTVVEHVNQTFASVLTAAVPAHTAEWQRRWEQADVQIDGDDTVQRCLRFAEYHLISAANPEDPRVSIGARALTGEAYKGHVFWDTDIYMVPFFTHTDPPSARALLEYRYHTLNAARAKARSAGLRGAMYPWESADTGEETTPAVAITPRGDLIRILNGAMEIHITADVAFAVWQYWKATADDDFFRQAGAEIMLETARFWASRGAFESDGYHLRHVIGPDEYHEDVDDDVYTNLLAAWNLRHGAESAALLQRRWPGVWRELQDRLQLTAEEVAFWPRLADRMFTGFDPQTQVFEQFSGYFKRKAVDLKRYEPRSAAMDVILGHNVVQQSNIVKQADVVMAIYLLWDDVSLEIRAANFRYYEPRTDHGSSLSPSIHALVAARLGETTLAQRYLQQAAEIDLNDTMGNASGGIHAAAMGGLWQAVVFGFAGLEVQADGLSFTPNLLPHWRRLCFPLQWRKRMLRVSIEPNALHVAVQGEHPFKLRVGSEQEIQAFPGDEYIAERSGLGWQPWLSTNSERGRRHP